MLTNDTLWKVSLLPPWAQFVQMKRRDFAATLATKSIVVVWDAHFKQKDYLPFMR